MPSTIIDEYLFYCEVYDSIIDNKEERTRIAEHLISLLPSFLVAWKFEFGEEPKHFVFRDTLLDDYIKDGRYVEAHSIVNRAHFDEESTVSHHERISCFSRISEAALPLIQDKPGIFESELISKIQEDQQTYLLWFLENSRTLQRVHAYSGYRYWLKNQDVHSHREEVPVMKIDTSIFGDWYIALSFYPTNSKKFDEVLSIAKDAPQFLESKDVSAKTYYQAVYSAKQDDFLMFVKLFKLAKDWKSSELFVNATKVDIRLFAPIIECYETKLRSDEGYCFGSEENTENPFGCHKLGLTQKNEPWWTYGNFDSKNVWHTNKKAIFGEIKTGMKLCRFCPAFSEKKALDVYENIPLEIDSDNDKNWYRSGYSLRPMPGKDPLLP